MRVGATAWHTNGVNSVSFSGDGKRIVSGSLDRTVRVWDAVSGECVLGPLEGPHWSGVQCRFLVMVSIVSGLDRTVRVWDLLLWGVCWGHWSTLVGCFSVVFW